jgi:UDP-N-acetylmuramate--alanine ligase
MGHRVYGSDASLSKNKREKLEKHKIETYGTHSGKHITNEISEVIYSQAIPKNNPELLEAKKRKIATLSYPKAIGKYLSNKKKICIAGTHGKTTTTAMIASIFLKAGKDPTVIVGSEVRELNNKNERLGKSNIAVIETCEYRNSFLDIPPSVLVITNIDFDHIDFYKTKRNYDASFLKYMNMVSKNGAIIYLRGDKTAERLAKKVEHPRVIAVIPQKITLKIPGTHNQNNAALALAAADYFKISRKKALKSLSEFSGTRRRLEYKGTCGKTKIYDDYGHHPTEIKATLKALRDLYPRKKILTIFQPHQYSRTKAFLDEFSRAFKQTDSLIISNIYEARDTPKDKSAISLEKLVREISKKHPKVASGKSIENTIKMTRKIAKNYDVIITMGAGNIYRVSNEMLGPA